MLAIENRKVDRAEALHEAYRELKAILDKAEAEGRDLTPEEAMQAHRLEAKIEALSALRFGDGDAREVRLAGLADVMRGLAGLPTQRAETRQLLAGSGSGSVLVSDYVARQFFDNVRAATVTAQAGVRVFNIEGHTARIPKVDSDPAVAWLSEGAQVGTSDPTLSAVELNPKVLATIVRVSRILLEDSGGLAEEIVERTLTRAVATELDRVVLGGSGSGAEPRGILNTTGIGSTALSAAPTSWDDLLDAAGAVREQNFEPTAMIVHPSVATLFSKFKDSTGRYIEKPGALPQVLVTTSMPQKTVLLGDFSQAILGLRAGLEMRVATLQERYADYLQVGFLVYSRADVGVVRPAAFHKVTWP